MGVKGLQTYVKNECPEACRMVSLQQMAEAHRKKFNCRPKLIVDGMNWIGISYTKTGLEWIYDAQWLQFKEYCKEFVDKFKAIDVELVFIFDGTVGSSKRAEWIRRRLIKYEETRRVFEDLENRWRAETGRIPTSTRIISSFLLIELGVKVIQTDREADDVIVHYAKKDAVFGIFSEDSDFMIYDTKDLFSIRHLNTDTLETVFYDRRCLAEKYLRLDVRQLPLFACLLGNNCVPALNLRRFHNRLKNQERGLPVSPAIAEGSARLIRDNNWTGNAFNLNQLRQISKEVFGNEGGMQMIKEGLKSYVVGNRNPRPPEPVQEIPQNLKDEVLRRHADCSLTADIYNILFYREYGSSDVMEDVDVKPSALIYQEIRQRCYGILFNFSQKPNSTNSIVVEEHCAYHGNMLETPEKVGPLPLEIFIRGQVPTIDRIWFEECSAEEKYKVFWATLNLPMEFDKMIKAPKEYLVFSCIINFLIGGSSTGPRLDPFDVAVFVAQAVWEKNISELKDLQVPKIESRAVNLTTLFMRGVAMVLLALGVCDYPCPFAYADPCHFIDGKQFHYLYSTAVNENRTVNYLCQTQNRKELFYSLLELVTNNTNYDQKKYDWKAVLQDFEH